MAADEFEFCQRLRLQGFFWVQCEVDNHGEVALPEGIIGAVIFRLVFTFVGKFLMHAFYLMHFIFGSGAEKFCSKGMAPGAGIAPSSSSMILHLSKATRCRVQVRGKAPWLA